MEISVQNHLLYALRNADKKNWPFPHFYAEYVFPWGFYDKLREFMRTNAEFEPTKDYANRSFARDSNTPGLEFMQTPDFIRHVMKIFQPEARQRWPEGKVELYMDCRLVRDGKGYFIGPHTDAAWKVVSLLFYLPDNCQHMEHGTRLYVPKVPGFVCPGGPHYKFDPFESVALMQFAPNTCFGFWKTANSFHGVEPVTDDFDRDVLLFNIYEKQAFDATHTSLNETDGDK